MGVALDGNVRWMEAAVDARQTGRWVEDSWLDQVGGGKLQLVVKR